MENPSDQELIRAHLHGDERALEALISRHLGPVYRFILRYVSDAADADDLTQETFVRAWKNLKTYDPERKFTTWIFQIAKNASLDALKKKSAPPFSDFDDAEGNNFIADTMADTAPLPSELLDRAGMSGTLAAALGQLSPGHRMVLFLHYNDHLTFREIAESLDQPLDTVKSRHRRGLIMLKAILSANAPKPDSAS